MKATGKEYACVSELVRDTSDPEFADEFDKYLAGRRVVKDLTVLRCAKGISQSDLADKIGCGRPKISKIESSTDADLKFGDIVAYANAIGLAVHVRFDPHDETHGRATPGGL